MTRSHLQIPPTRAVGYLAFLAVLTITVSVIFLLYNLRRVVLKKMIPLELK